MKLRLYEQKMLRHILSFGYRKGGEILGQHEGKSADTADAYGGTEE